MKTFTIFLISAFAFCFSACNEANEPNAAVLISEASLQEFPVDYLRFKWQGETGEEQKLELWSVDYNEDINQPKAPLYFSLGLPPELQPSVGSDVFILEYDQWEPVKQQEYKWQITTYYDNGDITKSNVHQFTPNN